MYIQSMDLPLNIKESEEGFKSMVNEMTTSQKTAAVHLYQQQLASTGTEVSKLKSDILK